MSSKLSCALAVLLTTSPLPAGDPQNARLGEQRDSAETLAEKERAEKPGIMGQSKQLVGGAVGKTTEALKGALPTAGQAQGWWQRSKAWCGQKWEALKAWWKGGS